MPNSRPRRNIGKSGPEDLPVSPRLKTHIWTGALLRRAQAAGAFVYIAQKGDPDSGIAMIKVCTLDGQAALYAPERNFAGESGYRQTAKGDERDMDEKIRNRAKMDPDLWVIEIEDREGRHFLTEDIFEI